MVDENITLLYGLKGVVLSMQVLTVLVIVLFYNRMSQFRESKYFKLSQISWILHFLYVLVNLISMFLYTGLEENVYVQNLKYFLDISFASFLLILYYKETSNKISLYTFLIFIVLFVTFILYPKIIVIPISVFLFIALYYHKLHLIELDFTEKKLIFGIQAYSVLQLFAILFVYLGVSGSEILDLIGFSVGFIIKVYIALGLLNIFYNSLIDAKFIERKLKEEKEHSTQIKKNTKKTIHEFFTPVLAIENQTAKVILHDQDPTLRNSKFRYNQETLRLIKDINSESILLLSILDAYASVDDLMDIDFKKEKIDFFRNNDLDETSINTLSFLAVQTVKNSKYMHSNKAEFTQEYSGNCQVLCYKNEIVMVLINLIRNSIDALTFGKNEIKITTYKDKDKLGKIDKTVTWMIEDTGHGMSEEQKENIFKFGYTTRSGKVRGIGMVVVEEKVTNNFGELKIYSPIHKSHEFSTEYGTRVKVILPRKL